VAHGHAAATLPARRAGRGRELSRRRTPERLQGIADSHCHLQDRQFDADRDAVLERAAAAGIERILVPGWDMASSEAALELAARHGPLLQAAVGVHPHDSAAADEAGEATWARIEALAVDPRCAAVGEIGLDFDRIISAPEVQRDAFARQLDLAARLAKPVLVHHRGAHAAVTDALLAWPGRPGRRGRGALHAFSGDAAMATRLSAAGFLISFALPVSFRSAAGPRAAAAALPSDAILLETDAPYLGPDRSRRNEPTTVLRVASEVARLRGETPESVAAGARTAYEELVAP
jgi:TatD DNase family protein